MRANRAPYSVSQSHSGLDYAYHFDAKLLGDFLRNHGLKQGIELIDDTVTNVIQHNSGDIASLETSQHGVQHADFFVDCTGFKGLLIQQALGESVTDYSNYLPNNRAVAIAQSHSGNGPEHASTISKGLENGWSWSIPLMSRNGNGYVYCDDFISPSQAEARLRAALSDEDSTALHLQWTPGRIEQHWKRNCLAVGLSQGFLEPLEAPMLNIVQQTCETFLSRIGNDQSEQTNQREFNGVINRMIDGTRDYLQAHFVTNTRDDSDYWRANRNNTTMSDTLSDILSTWKNNQDLTQAFTRHADLLTYKKTSWYCLLAGMDYFSAVNKPSSRIAMKKQQRISDICQSKALTFNEHQQYLRQFQEVA